MLRIDRAHPTGGFPGTLLTLDGEDFGAGLDDSRVLVGGTEALVVRATPQQLLVVLGEGTTSGDVEVVVNAASALAPEPFIVAEQPDVRDTRQSGPPLFFTGPQHSSPRLSVADQPVLCVMVHGKDQPPDNPTAAQAAEMTGFEDANRYWREATYGRTSFAFASTGWLPLPGPRSRYVWDPDDIAWARRQLVMWTKADAALTGDRLLATHQGFRLTLVGVDGPVPVERDTVMDIGTPLHVCARGRYAYLAAGTSGIRVVDLAAAPPAAVGTVALPGTSVSCDTTGDLLVVAALEGGLHVLDITAPGTPALRGTLVLPAWATTVRAQGSRAYVGSGTSLVAVDLTAPALPSFLGAAPAGAWVMGVDVAGSTCVAATDGAGLATFDVSGASPVVRGREQGVLRLHAVTLSGTTAFCAAGEHGLATVGVGNLATPVLLSTVLTARACYGITVAGGRAWLSVGGKVMVPADVSDPANPLLGAEVALTGVFIFGSDPDLAGLRRNLTVAQDQQGTLKGEVLIVDALAALPGVDLRPFQGIVVVLAGDGPARGQSWVTNQVADGERKVVFPDAKGIIWLGANAHWGRRAHELGHWFGMPDVYEEAFDDGRVVLGTAAPWDMAGAHDSGPLFSGRQAERMQLYDPANITRRVWDPGVGPGQETFVIVAHGGTQDTGGGIHLLELVVAQGMSYWVEARRRPVPGTAVFDAAIPLGEPVPNPPGRVLVTRVAQGTAVTNNASERPTMLHDVLDVGGDAVDAARLLRIHVDERLSEDPLTYRVTVFWNEEPPPNPDGLFDLSITPWDTRTWESVDIWVNSVRNDGATVAYEFHEPGDPGRPLHNGDRPWVKRRNTVFARVRNTGVAAVSDVHVTCYTSSPPGIGDNGTWTTLATRRVPSIAANSETVVQFDWAPESDRHTCISVAVMPKAGEIEPRNNRGQENVAVFDSAGSSSHDPVVLDAEVRSPFSVRCKVDLKVADLPAGWHAVVEPSWVWLDPRGSVPARAVVWTDLHSPRARVDRIADEAFARVEGWTTYDHRYVPIGGILAAVRANARSRLVWEMAANGSDVFVSGYLDPQVAGVPFTVEVTDETGAARHLSSQTDADGVARVEMRLPDGEYAVQVFTAATRAVAEAEGEVRTLRLP